MKQAIIVNVSTKIHPDDIQMIAMKLIMIPFLLSARTKYDNFHSDENRNNADL
jgi:hypothetical protein